MMAIVIERRRQLHDLGLWGHGVTSLLRRVLPILQRTLEAWDAFDKNYARCLYREGSATNVSEPALEALTNIATHFRELEKFEDDLLRLQDDFEKDFEETRIKYNDEVSLPHRLQHETALAMLNSRIPGQALSLTPRLLDDHGAEKRH